MVSGKRSAKYTLPSDSLDTGPAWRRRISGIAEFPGGGIVGGSTLVVWREVLSKTPLLAITLAILACSADLLSAQGSESPARLSGSVRTDDGIGIDLAEIELVGARRRFRTGSSGRFQFSEIGPGRYFLSIKRIGFQPVYTALTIDPGDHREYHFTLHLIPKDLPDVVVESATEALNRGLRAFEFRSQSQVGTFLTRDQIEAFGVSQLSFLVRRYLPTLAGPGSGQEIVRLGAGGRTLNVGSTGCTPTVAVNGNIQRERIPLDLFSVGSVEALEIFTADEIPAELRARTRRTCGLVMVWL